MSWERYARTNHPVPYVLEAKAGGGALFYFGARHIGEVLGLPTDPEVEQIVRAWDAFRPEIAFYEGRSTYGRDLASVEDAAAKAGEGGVLRFLAARDAVPTASLEPSFENEVRGLRAWFPVDQIKVYFILRCVPQKCTGPGTPEEQALRWAQRNRASAAFLGDLPEAIPALDALVKRVLPEIADWRLLAQSDFDPRPAGRETFLNAISRRSSDLRDEYMVEALLTALRQRRRVFAVVGASHVVMQEPALRAALSSQSLMRAP